MAPSPLICGIVLVVFSPGTSARPPRSSRSPPLLLFGDLRGLPPLQLVPAHQGAAQALRPLQHLPHHRRHLHAVRGRAARRPTRPRMLLHRLGAAPRRRAVPRVLGRRAALALHAGSTSRSAGSRCSTCVRSGTGGPLAVIILLAVGGLLYSARRPRLRAPRGRTRRRAGSASTRSSTRSPCWRSSPQYIAVSFVTATDPRTTAGTQPVGGPSAPRPSRPRPSLRAARRATSRCCSPTSLTHQASASEREQPPRRRRGCRAPAARAGAAGS